MTSACLSSAARSIAERGFVAHGATRRRPRMPRWKARVAPVMLTHHRNLNDCVSSPRRPRAASAGAYLCQPGHDFPRLRRCDTMASAVSSFAIRSRRAWWDHDATHHSLSLHPAPPRRAVLTDTSTRKSAAEDREQKPISRRDRGRDALIRDTQYTSGHGCGFRRSACRARLRRGMSLSTGCSTRRIRKTTDGPEVEARCSIHPVTEERAELPKSKPCAAAGSPDGGRAFVRVEQRRPDCAFRFQQFQHTLEGRGRGWSARENYWRICHLGSAAMHLGCPARSA